MDTAGAQVHIAALAREQAGWCARLGSPLYASLLESLATDVEAGGPAWAVLEGREDDPPPSALMLRLMGAVHRLVLTGAAPELARHYPSAGGDATLPGARDTFRAALAAHAATLRTLVTRPVQTNEVGRSAALVGGFLLVAAESGLPLRCLEIGASAGLNLRWDHFRYEGPRGSWGDPASPVRIAEVFDPAPPFDTAARVVERAGCDPAPLDATTDDGALTLQSYLWPDQPARFALLRGALAIARR